MANTKVYGNIGRCTYALERPRSSSRVPATIQNLTRTDAVLRPVDLAIHVTINFQGASLDALVAAVHGTIKAAVGVLLTCHARCGTSDVMADTVGAIEDTIHSFISRVDWRVAIVNIDIVGGYYGAS